MLIIGGATKAIVSCARQDGSDCVTTEVSRSDTCVREMMDKIIHGWQIFEKDLAMISAAWRAAPGRTVPAIVAPEQMPSIVLEIDGRVLKDNLTAFESAVMSRVRAISTDLRTDEDFAEAESVVKILARAEKDIEESKYRAISQAEAIHAVFATLDNMRGEIRAKLLELKRTIKSRKDAIRNEIIEEAMATIENGRVPTAARNRIAESMKGRKTYTTLRDAALGEAAKIRIELAQDVARVEQNIAWLRAERPGVPASILPDLEQLAGKDSESFRAIVDQRVADHEAAMKKADEERKKQEIKAYEIRHDLPPCPSLIYIVAE
jgi:hypothetical protein